MACVPSADPALTVQRGEWENSPTLRLLKEHLPSGNDAIELLVLKGHLLIEQLLRELLALAIGIEHQRRARINFFALANLVRGLIGDDPVWDVCEKLNSVRNAYSHELAPTSVGERIDRFTAAARARMSNVPDDPDRRTALYMAILGLHATLHAILDDRRERLAASREFPR
jgi:hypothetical protein